MAPIVLLVFVFAVLSHFAESQDCSVEKEVRTNQTYPTGWTGEFIYGVRVCLHLQRSPTNCSRTQKSIALAVHNGTFNDVFVNFFTPTQEGDQFCEIFSPCRISKAFVNKPISATTFRASAEFLVSDQNSEDVIADLRISAVNLTVDQPGDTPAVSHGLLSVICTFSPCSVRDGEYGGDAKYYFTVAEKNRAPVCVKDAATPGAFSVTLFSCDPTCTRNYTVVKSTVDPPPRPGSPATPAIVPYQKVHSLLWLFRGDTEDSPSSPPPSSRVGVILAIAALMCLV